MNVDLYQRAVSVFIKAIECPPDQLQEFLDTETQGQDDLRALVERMIESDSSSRFLDEPYEPSDLNDVCVDPISVDGYLIIKRLSAHRSGNVFLARQTLPSRKVVLKLAKVTPDENDGVHTHEATLLSKLRHDSIARVYEAGVGRIHYEDGSVVSGLYVAMEYIDGETLQARLERQPYSRAGAITAVLQICDAVAHAHQRGVIHRDLKPSNIILDESGSPVVIDFGIATIPSDSADNSYAGSAGTLQYMAPEQMLLGKEDVDTLVDIYAIGVIGYELLTSTKLHTVSHSVSDSILERMTHDYFDMSLLRQHSGAEFAAIFARVLDPDPAKRYQSVIGLMDDMKRVQNGYSPMGVSLSAKRRLRLYWNRHRFIASALLLMVLIVIASLSGLVYSNSVASKKAMEAELMHQLAMEESVRSQKLADFFKVSLYGVDPEENGSEITLFEAIERAASRIHRDLADTPSVEAEVRQAIGFIYRRHGNLKKATEQTQLSYRLCLNLYGPNDDKTLSCAEELGYLAWLYEGDSEKALRILLPLRDHYDPDHHSAQGWLNIKIGSVLLETDEPAKALAYLEPARAQMVEAYGEVYEARPLRFIAYAHALLGEFETAAVCIDAAIELCKSASEQEYILARCYAIQAEICILRSEFESASRSIEQCRTIFDRLLPADHIEQGALLATQARLANNGFKQPAAAVQSMSKAEQIFESYLPESHPDRVSARAFISMYEALGSASDYAIQDLESGYDQVELAFGPDHFVSLSIHNLMIDWARKQEDSQMLKIWIKIYKEQLARRHDRISGALSAE